MRRVGKGKWEKSENYSHDECMDGEVRKVKVKSEKYSHDECVDAEGGKGKVGKQ